MVDLMWSIRKNPNQVDTRTVRVLMEVAELHRKHLGGQLLFSPDGLLHIILGDGMITLDDMEEMDGLRWGRWSEDAKKAFNVAAFRPRSQRVSWRVSRAAISPAPS